jgi:hypothetical protein
VTRLLDGRPIWNGSPLVQAVVVTAKILVVCGYLHDIGGHLTGSYGTARLELLYNEAVLRGRGPFGPLVRWAASYGDMVEAKAVLGIGNTGLLLCGPGYP